MADEDIRDFLIALSVADVRIKGRIEAAMPALVPATEARMDALRRVLTWGDHFRLILVSAEPGPAREAFLERLRAWSGREGVPSLVEVQLEAVERPVPRIREVAGEFSTGSRPEFVRGSGIVLMGFEQFLVSDRQATPAIQELNFFRDELPDVLPGPLVFIGTRDAITHLLGVAPDFVSIRAFTLDVEVAPEEDASANHECEPRRKFGHC